MDTNNPSYRMKSLLDHSSAGSLISHTIAEEEEGHAEDEDDDPNDEPAADDSGRFNSVSHNLGTSKPEVACSACGFESTFVHDGMMPCLRCNAVFYCSSHCRSWDWNSGGHRKNCKQQQQQPQLLSGSQHSQHEQQRHSLRNGGGNGGGSETSTSSLDAEHLFEMGGGSGHGSPGPKAEPAAAASHQRQQQQQQQPTARDNTTTRSSNKNKTLSSFLDRPKAPPTTHSSALPNPFGNRHDDDDDDEHDNDNEGGGGVSGSYDDESLCMSQLDDGSITAPLQAITEESQVSEAQTADASWRTKEVHSAPRRSVSAASKESQQYHHYDMFDNTVVEESEGDYSVDYDNQDAQALQDDDDKAYGVHFGLGQSDNSLSAAYDDNTHREEMSGLLEIDSKGTGSSCLLDPHDEDENDSRSADASSQHSAESSSSLGSQNDDDVTATPGASQNEEEGPSSPGSSAATTEASEQTASRGVIGSRSDSDKSLLSKRTDSDRSILKQFREVYNRSSGSNGSGDFHSSSQRSAASLREFRTVYNSDDIDASMSSSSSSDASVNENVPRSFLGSMHSIGCADDDLVVGAIIDLKQGNDAVKGGGTGSRSGSARSTLQQARERFQAKKETLNEALIHYKHKFGESAAVQALDKFAGVKESKVDIGKDSKVGNGKDSKVGHGKDHKLDKRKDSTVDDNELQWERQSIPSKSPASYAAYRDLLKARPPVDAPDNGRTPTEVYPPERVPDAVTPPIADNSRSEPLYDQYRRVLKQQRRNEVSQARSSTIDDRPLSSRGPDSGAVDSVGQYTKYRRQLKNSPNASGNQYSGGAATAATVDEQESAPYTKHRKLSGSRPSAIVSSPLRENDSGSLYAKYRSTLRPSSDTADTDCDTEGDAPGCFGKSTITKKTSTLGDSDALQESNYAAYRSALAPSLSDAFRNAPPSGGSRSLPPAGAAAIDEHDAAHYERHRGLSNTSSSNDASAPFSRADSDRGSLYTNYRSTLKPATEITPTVSSYALYRSALAPSVSNSSLSRKNHEFRKDEHTFGENFSSTAPITTPSAPLHAEYSPTQSSLVTSKVKASSASVAQQQSYLVYRKSLGLQSVIQKDAAGKDAASDVTADPATSSSPSQSQTMLSSQYSAYRSKQRAECASKPRFHALSGNSIAESDSESFEERSDEFLSEQKTNQPVSDRYSSYRVSQSLALPSTGTRQKSSTDGGGDGVTPSWYQKYREALVPASSKQDKMSDKESILHDRKADASEAPAGKSVYGNYRQKLRVRFRFRSEDTGTDKNNEKLSMEQMGNLDEKSLLPDYTVSHSVDIETPEPSQSESFPDAVASPTSRSTSSVTSNTDVDNADATLMPRYLYYKFSLDKVEMSMKEPSHDQNEAQDEKVGEENHEAISEESSDMFEVRDSDSSVSKSKQLMSVGSVAVDLPIVSLDSATARDFTLLGIDSSVVQNDMGQGSFLSTWQQVEQDVTAVGEERAQAMALFARPTPTFNNELQILPSQDIHQPIISNPITETSLGTGHRIDIDDPQQCSNGDGSTSSAEVHNDKPGMGRKFWLLFLRHGTPPLILCLLALGIALGIARTRRDFRSRDSSPTPSPSAFVVPADARAELFNMIVNASFDEGRGIQTPSSPQLLAFNWLLSDYMLLELHSSEFILQRYALGCLFYSTDGDKWLNKTDWLSDKHECSWYSRLSVNEVCDAGGRYINLDISLNNLGGTFPAELALMSNLKTINLIGGGGNASIGGVLPTQLGLLSSLETISLRSNNLFGGLPTELGLLTKLRSMDFGLNQLSLDIPSVFKNLVALQTMNLEMNLLTGDLPTEISNLGALETLALGGNRMTGRVLVGGQMSSLKVLNLEQNRFTSISPGLGALVNLETLTMYETDVTGNLQSEIAKLRSLKRLSLHSNRLFGRLPDFLGSMTELQDLDLSFNAFSGPIPTQIGGLPNLTRLDLSSNFLTGTIPDQLGLLTAATLIRIDDNDITGNVSVAVCSSYESAQPRFYLDCGSPEITCPPESLCCTFCCTDGDGCDCALDAENEHLCFAH